MKSPLPAPIEQYMELLSNSRASQQHRTLLELSSAVLNYHASVLLSFARSTGLINDCIVQVKELFEKRKFFFAHSHNLLLNKIRMNAKNDPSYLQSTVLQYCHWFVKPNQVNKAGCSFYQLLKKSLSLPEKAENHITHADIWNVLFRYNVAHQNRKITAQIEEKLHAVIKAYLLHVVQSSPLISRSQLILVESVSFDSRTQVLEINGSLVRGQGNHEGLIHRIPLPQKIPNQGQLYLFFKSADDQPLSLFPYYLTKKKSLYHLQFSSSGKKLLYFDPLSHFTFEEKDVIKNRELFSLIRELPEQSSEQFVAELTETMEENEEALANEELNHEIVEENVVSAEASSPPDIPLRKTPPALPTTEERQKILRKSIGKYTGGSRFKYPLFSPHIEKNLRRRFSVTYAKKNGEKSASTDNYLIPPEMRYIKRPPLFTSVGSLLLILLGVALPFAFVQVIADADISIDEYLQAMQSDSYIDPSTEEYINLFDPGRERLQRIILARFDKSSKTGVAQSYDTTSDELPDKLKETIVSSKAKVTYYDDELELDDSAECQFFADHQFLMCTMPYTDVRNVTRVTLNLYGTRAPAIIISRKHDINLCIMVYKGSRYWSYSRYYRNDSFNSYVKEYTSLKCGDAMQLKKGSPVFIVRGNTKSDAVSIKGIIERTNIFYQDTTYLLPKFKNEKPLHGEAVFNAMGEVIGILNCKAMGRLGLPLIVPINYLATDRSLHNNFSAIKELNNSEFKKRTAPAKAKAKAKGRGRGRSRGRSRGRGRVSIDKGAIR